MHVVTLPSRQSLPALFERLGLVNVGVELGVASGAFSAEILAGCSVNLLISVDTWAGDRGHNDAQFQAACDRLLWFAGRSKILRMDFTAAAGQIPDGTLDFCYVDGYAHTGNRAGATFCEWWPKVREGGLFGGHDYSERWPKNKAAVDAFITEVGATRLLVTEEPDTASWMIRRPTRDQLAGDPPFSRETPL